jgi:hypothetical protein
MLILLAGEVQLDRQTPVGKEFLSARCASSGRIFPEERGGARLVAERSIADQRNSSNTASRAHTLAVANSSVRGGHSLARRAFS